MKSKVLLLLLVMSGIRPGYSQTINIKSLIDSLSLALSNNYIFPEKAKLIVNYLDARKNNGSYLQKANDPGMLAQELKKDIYKVHRDPHMTIEFDPGLAQQLSKNSSPSPHEINSRQKFWKDNNYMFTRVEILPGNIGYISFNGFVDDVQAAKGTITSAFRFLAHSSSLIIDLRKNGGGSPEMVNQIQSYFFKERTHMNDIINGITKDTTVFYTDPAKADSTILSMPVYILTSASTFSAAEDFTYGMQTAKRAKVIGEVTGGGAHPCMPLSLGQGFVLIVPFARSLNPITQTDWEGTGVIPDVKVPAEKGFKKAQELILLEQQSLAKEEKEKGRLQYLLQALKLEDNKGSLPVSVLSKYVGNYEGFEFYLDKGRLFCNNSDRDHFISELKHLEQNLFVLDENVHVDFLQDQNGDFASIKLFFNNGITFDRSKTTIVKK